MGKWGHTQVLPALWVQESFKQRIAFPRKVARGTDGYGYQFWMWPDQYLNKPFQMISAIGNGGQNIFWDLQNDLTVVVTAGNFNRSDTWQDSYALVKNEIYPVAIASL